MVPGCETLRDITMRVQMQVYCTYPEENGAGGGIVSRLQGVSYSEVAAKADEAHVHYGGGTGEDVAGGVHVAPDHSEGPVS